MSKPHVAVASLGGTITMVSDRAGDASIRPSLDVDALLDAVPSLGNIATLETQTLAMKPGASLSRDDILGALHWARSAVARGAGGAIVIQGTDTIEETAYLLDLYWDRAEPLVVTGAMRSPMAASADGSANLLSSVTVASSAAARDLGALVVMNDVVHAASRVRKTRTSDLNAFASVPFGPLGQVVEGEVFIANRPTRFPAIPLPDSGTAPRVALLETYLGDDGALLDLIAPAAFDGVVLAGFGVGHVSGALAQVVERSIAALPIVLASRAGSGTTFSKTYGFPGSEVDLLAHGVIGAGWLDARKARILLAALIASGSSRSDIEAQFTRRGANPGGGVEVEYTM